MVAWNVVCTPKQYGGLGVHNLKFINLALRCRWRWLEMVAGGKPWADMPIEIPREAESVFLAGTRCIIGDGRRFKFWQDRWLEGRSMADLAPALFQFIKPAAKARTVASALLDGSWAHDFSGSPSIPAIAEFFELWDLLRYMTLSEVPDAVSWCLEVRGMFAARSAYQAMFLGRELMTAVGELLSSWAPLDIKEEY